MSGRSRRIGEALGADRDRYAAVVGGLAVEFGGVHVATQRAFDDVLAVSAPGDWAEDRIHPGPPGHAVIADAFLRAIGADQALFAYPATDGA